MALREDLQTVFHEPVVAKPREFAPKNEPPITYEVVIDSFRKPNRLTVIALGGAALAIAAGIGLGLATTDTMNTPGRGTAASAGDAPKNDNPDSTTPGQKSFSEATNFNLTTEGLPSKDEFGTFGTYGVYNQKISSVVSGQRYDITIESAKVILKTYSISEAVSFKDGQVDPQANTVTKKIEIDPTKMAYGAELTDLKLSFDVVSPGQQLKESGNYVTGCKSLPVWGCPGNLTPPTNLVIPKPVSDVLIASVKSMILRAVEKDCAQLEYLNTFQFIDANSEKQAKDQDVKSGLITPVIVGTDLKIISNVPNYVYSLQKELKAQGATISDSDIATVFGQSSIQATCKPIDVNKA